MVTFGGRGGYQRQEGRMRGSSAELAVLCFLTWLLVRQLLVTGTALHGCVHFVKCKCTLNLYSMVYVILQQNLQNKQNRRCFDDVTLLHRNLKWFSTAFQLKFKLLSFQYELLQSVRMYFSSTIFYPSLLSTLCSSYTGVSYPLF